MATTQKTMMFWGDSRVAGYYDFAGMSLRGKILMAFPEYTAVGTVHDLIIGPQSTASAIPNPFLGDNRSYNAATVGYGIANVTAAIAARLAAVAPTVPNVHVILCGINDINGGRTSAQMLTDAAACLDAFHAASASARIVWLGEPNVLYLAGANDSVRVAFNSGMSGTTIPARSAWASWIAMPTTLGARDMGDYDKIHPSAWGFNRMADLAIPGLKAIPI